MTHIKSLNLFSHITQLSTTYHSSPLTSSHTCLLQSVTENKENICKSRKSCIISTWIQKWKEWTGKEVIGNQIKYKKWKGRRMEEEAKSMQKIKWIKRGIERIVHKVHTASLLMMSSLSPPLTIWGRVFIKSTLSLKAPHAL